MFLTALGVGGATIFGAAIGYFTKGLSARFENIVTAFSAGIMLAAAMVGLIFPALESDGKWCLLKAMTGIFSGALCMDILGRVVIKLHPETYNNKVLLLVAAIAIHNLPEGMAAGVGFGSGDTANALMIAGGIALQNVPEGMVIIGPMLASGIKPDRTLFYASLTGVIEIIGTILGYLTVNISTTILPFCLAFAGGTMLFIICGEMIPSSCCSKFGNASAYSLLAGFCAMLAFGILI